jgi:hypothetical protein
MPHTELYCTVLPGHERIFFFADYYIIPHASTRAACMRVVLHSKELCVWWWWWWGNKHHTQRQGVETHDTRDNHKHTHTHTHAHMCIKVSAQLCGRQRL